MAYVLVDDSALRPLLTEVPTPSGRQVATPFNRAEALMRLEEHYPDTMLLDLEMPVMDGWTLLRACRGASELSNINVVVMSALEDAFTTVGSLGVRHCLCKPFAVTSSWPGSRPRAFPFSPEIGGPPASRPLRWLALADPACRPLPSRAPKLDGRGEDLTAPGSSYAQVASPQIRVAIDEGAVCERPDRLRATHGPARSLATALASAGADVRAPRAHRAAARTVQRELFSSSEWPPSAQWPEPYAFSQTARSAASDHQSRSLSDLVETPIPPGRWPMAQRSAALVASAVV